jgi:hypothetical protein
MIKLNYKRKKVVINHIDSFIKPFQNEFQFRKTYFDEISNKLINYKKIFVSDVIYYYVFSMKDYKKYKYSFFIDVFFPVQALILRKILTLDRGRYIIGTSFYNYEFIRNHEYCFSGIIVKERPSIILNDEDLKSLAIESLEDSKTCSL